MRKEPRPSDATSDRPARRGGLEDRLASHARELRPDMADRLEVRGNVLELLGDVLADEAQSATASDAAALLTVRVMMSGVVSGR